MGWRRQWCNKCGSNTIQISHLTRDQRSKVQSHADKSTAQNAIFDQLKSSHHHIGQETASEPQQLCQSHRQSMRIFCDADSQFGKHQQERHFNRLKQINALKKRTTELSNVSQRTTGPCTQKQTPPLTMANTAMICWTTWNAI